MADFPPEELKSIYTLRWGIETSFRALKYTVGLTNFHAKKQESIIQEIFARMILYNFVEMVTSHFVISQSNRQYHYQVNFTIAFTFVDSFCAPEAMNPRSMLKH
ncbi:MAG: hypothetical protein K0Q90_4293 [Paenibacillaceae bacterium]|nr:hypothetical protein [Paenibacillaceae bacterium]